VRSAVRVESASVEQQQQQQQQQHDATATSAATEAATEAATCNLQQQHKRAVSVRVFEWRAKKKTKISQIIPFKKTVGETQKAHKMPPVVH